MAGVVDDPSVDIQRRHCVRKWMIRECGRATPRFKNGTVPSSTIRTSYRIYRADEGLPLHKSHENPSIQTLYKDFLGEPNSHKAHELLHTHYTAWPKYTK